MTGLELAQRLRNPPDVFLVDYHLMDMDGVTLIKSLRSDAKFAKTPIVMASGLDVEHEALGAGANAFLTKPYEPDDLAELFKTFTAKPEPAAPTSQAATPPAAAATSVPPTDKAESK
jgi:CheY-like chemotaxis protein